MRPIETQYKGYRFRSRLEARWAVFFDACGVEWEYEPEGFDLGNGVYYLPDFLLYDLAGRASGDLYVEVKGKMTDEDAGKIKRFAKEAPILVVGKIPDENFVDYVSCAAYRAKPDHPYYFNFETIDGDHFAAHPGVNKNGKFELFGDDLNYLHDMNYVATGKAYRLARQARFEYDF